MTSKFLFLDGDSLDRIRCALVPILALVLVSGGCSNRDDGDADRLCEILAGFSAGDPLTPDGIGEGLDVAYLEAFEEMADVAPAEILPSAEKALAGLNELSALMEAIRSEGQQPEGEIAEVAAPLLAGFEELLTWSETNCRLEP